MSANPGRVREIVPIDLPRDRTLASARRAEFVRTRRAPARACWGRWARMTTSDLAADPVARYRGRRSRLSRARARSAVAPASPARGRHRGGAARLVGAGRTVFDVPPFIAPSPLLVCQTLYAKIDLLLLNLLPTAIEAFRRIPARQSGRDPDRHRVRAQQDDGGHLLPGRRRCSTRFRSSPRRRSSC